MTSLETVTLASTTYGDTGPRLALLHGLFGQGRNFTGVAKELADQARVTLLDLPDHGRSPWSEDFSYVAVADRVADFLTAYGAGERWTVAGHSMGGKVAMLLALRHPEQVERLVVVDIGPSGRDARAGFTPYVEAMRGVDLSALDRRSDADALMSNAVPDPAVRGFLLQNLRHDPTAAPGEQWRWQMNLDVLADHLDQIGGWPDTGHATYDGPVLWVAGDGSDYVSEEDLPTMKALFPRVRKVVVKDAGHWVHADQPEVLVEVLRRFLSR